MTQFRSFVPPVCVRPPPPSRHRSLVAGFCVEKRDSLTLVFLRVVLDIRGPWDSGGVALTLQMALGSCHLDGVTSVDHEIGNLST